MASLPPTGAPAPDFTLPSTSGIDVTLSKLREFQVKERISVDLLSDFKREVSRRYGTQELLAQLEAHPRSA